MPLDATPRASRRRRRSASAPTLRCHWARPAPRATRLTRCCSEGPDPVERKVKVLASVEQQSNTFELVARAWHAKRKVRWSEVHASDVIRSLERAVFPKIGALPISTIKAPSCSGY